MDIPSVTSMRPLVKWVTLCWHRQASSVCRPVAVAMAESYICEPGSLNGCSSIG